MHSLETWKALATIWLSVKYEYLNAGDTIVFELYRSVNNNENEYEAKPLEKKKTIANGGSGICEVDWLYSDKYKDPDKHEEPDTFRNNLKLYFTAHIEESSDIEIKSDDINVSNDCECQSFFDKNKTHRNPYGLKPQTTRNTYGAHCDIMAWNKALESGYDPRGFILDDNKNIIKESWDANDIMVKTLYNKYFSKYNTLKKTILTDARSIYFRTFLKFFGETKYHTPPAGTAGFIFFKDAYKVFYHVEFYDFTKKIVIDGVVTFKQYETEGIRKVKPLDDGALIPKKHRYYVPLDKF